MLKSMPMPNAYVTFMNNHLLAASLLLKCMFAVLNAILLSMLDY